MPWDASRQNEKRSSRVYKDLNLNFSANPVTGDVTTVTDVNALDTCILYDLFYTSITTCKTIGLLSVF